jgi:oxygen-independent coproporphyrinogen-3 oxidase
MNQNSGGVYVHVPFCVRKCSYCDFISYPAGDNIQVMEAYLSSVVDELRLRKTELEQIRPITTLYVGGGTPTCVPWQKLAPFVSTLIAEVEKINASDPTYGGFDSADLETTVEANPGTVDPHGLAALRQSGVNRLSLGFQSLDARELASLGRVHSPEDCLRAYEWAREAGFDNVSVDLILGAPGQTGQSLAQTLDAVISLGPQHLSAYCLSVEEGTVLARAIASGVQTVPDDDLVAEFYEWLVSRVEDAGYVRYEVSNFAIPGFESVHNIRYWTCGYYVGLGVAAHSHLPAGAGGSVRSWNVESVDKYVASISEGTRALSGFEERTAFEEAQDRLMLGLRMSEGIDLASIGRLYGEDLLGEYGARFADLAEKGLVNFSGGKVRLTPRGFLLGNLVFSECVDCGDSAQS